MRETRTFASLIDALRGRFDVLRVGERAVVLEVAGRRIELFRVQAGSEEWAAITCDGGFGAPPRNPGLGVPVTFGARWGLRLVLPVAGADADTVERALRRLAAEAGELAAQSIERARSPLFEMWAETAAPCQAA